MYVTIGSVMLQVQRYLHVNRQKKLIKGNICPVWQIFTERESGCYATYRKCIEILGDPEIGWPRKKKEERRRISVTQCIWNSHRCIGISVEYDPQLNGSKTFKRGPYFLLKKLVWRLTYLIFIKRNLGLHHLLNKNIKICKLHFSLFSY